MPHSLDSSNDIREICRKSRHIEVYDLYRLRVT